MQKEEYGQKLGLLRCLVKLGYGRR